MQQAITFTINITPEQFLRYYKGLVQDIQLKAEDGRLIRFPASAIKPFLTHDGIQGRFEIRIDENNKLAGLVRI